MRHRAVERVIWVVVQRSDGPDRGRIQRIHDRGSRPKIRIDMQTLFRDLYIHAAA